MCRIFMIFFPTWFEIYPFFSFSFKINSQTAGNKGVQISIYASIKQQISEQDEDAMSCHELPVILCEQYIERKSRSHNFDFGVEE